MKRLIFAGCLNMVLACGAFAAQLPGYTNSGYVASSHLVIDATNVVNLGIFDISLPNSDGQFSFSDVLTYTNRNVMFCTTGFHFNDSPASFGDSGPSVNFVNQNPGQVYGGALDLPVSLTFSGSGSSPRIIIESTNIVNSGILQVGQAGEIRVTGSSLDLSHGTELVEGFDQAGSGAVSGGLVLGPGEFIDFWGGGAQSNVLFISNLSAARATSPVSRITNNTYGVGTFSFFMQPPQAIALTNMLNPSNIYTQVILYLDAGPNNSGSQVTQSAYFLPQTVTQAGVTNYFRTAVVKWGVQVTDAFGVGHSNTLYLTDDLGAFPNTNLTFATNNFSFGGLAELVASNYTIGPTFRGGPLTNTGNGPYSASLFTNGFGTNGTGIGAITNGFAMLGVTLQPVTSQPDPSFLGSTVSNVSGRVEITAGQSLNLTGAVINAGNYLNLSSPNDYRGSQGAQISFPYADINLGSSNGQMTISNLVVPYLARFQGPIWAWTGTWTNLTMATNIVPNGTNAPTTNTFSVTNAFMVTMVASQLATTIPPNLESLDLRSTNLVISDALNVNSNMVIDAQNLTITSNAPGDLTPTGLLVFAPTDQSQLYSANFPSMLNFTNFGTLTTTNAAFFQVRQDPNFQMGGDGPWQSIVNHGLIASPGPQSPTGPPPNGGGGLTFWANYFENTGLSPLSAASIQATGSAFGPVFVQASTALITNSFLTAGNGDIQVISGNLTLNNATLSSSGFLNLGESNLLTDLTAAGSSTLVNPVNFLSSSDGFSLVTAPTSLSGLLGTSVTSACRTGAVCQNTWAGLPDLALVTNVAGTPLPTMANNAPIGQLILDGGDNNSVFHFQGADTVNPYAMYVDQIELADGATNFAGGKYTAFNIDPNMTIYFLKANLANSTNSIAPVLAGQAAGGGHLVWLNNNVGHFSATKVTYADGQSFSVNSSYVQAYGLPPEPPVPLTPQNIQLQIGTINVGSNPVAAISWYAQAHSSNTLYYRTLTNPNWLVRTNFVQGATGGRVTNLDSMGASHLYKVSVSQ